MPGAMLAEKIGWSGFDLLGLFDCEPPYPKPEAISFERATASYAAIDLDPPQYDDDGRDERGQH
jgi:hypothetical protein